MIEPTFVGLLAAAFVFLYAQLTAMVRFEVERLNNPQMLVYGWKVWKEEFEDYADFAGQYIWEIKGLYVPLFVSLVPYLIGVLSLVGGYVWDEMILVYTGLVMLSGAFVLMGYYSLWFLSRHVIGRDEMVEWIVLKIRAIIKEKEEEELQGGGDVGVGG